MPWEIGVNRDLHHRSPISHSLDDLLYPEPVCLSLTDSERVGRRAGARVVGRARAVLRSPSSKTSRGARGCARRRRANVQMRRDGAVVRHRRRLIHVQIIVTIVQIDLDLA